MRAIVLACALVMGACTHEASTWCPVWYPVFYSNVRNLADFIRLPRTASLEDCRAAIFREAGHRGLSPDQRGVNYGNWDYECGKDCKPLSDDPTTCFSVLKQSGETSLFHVLKSNRIENGFRRKGGMAP